MKHYQPTMIDDTGSNGMTVIHSNLTQGTHVGWPGIKKVGSTANSNLTIDSAGTGHVVINTSATGNVGIGVAAPSAKLEVAANTAIKVGNAYMSSGGDFAMFATHEWYNGSVWQGDGTAGCLYLQNGQGHIWYKHDNAQPPANTVMMSLDSSNNLTLTSPGKFIGDGSGLTNLPASAPSISTGPTNDFVAVGGYNQGPNDSGTFYYLVVGKSSTGVLKVISGYGAAGSVIPLPADCAQADCSWIVSCKYYPNGCLGQNMFNTQITAGRAVTVRTYGTNWVSCWVAAELFGGWNDERTHFARFFILTSSPEWFRKAYQSYGEKFSLWISDKPVVKNFLLPIFQAFSFFGKRKALRMVTL